METKPPPEALMYDSPYNQMVMNRVQKRQYTKYFGKQHARYGGTLHWPGANGLPVRGERTATLKDSEYGNLPNAAEFFENTFDLSVEEDREHYKWVRDHISNYAFREEFVHREWDKENKCMIIYLEWAQYYAYIPPNYQSDQDVTDHVASIK